MPSVKLSQTSLPNNSTCSTCGKKFKNLRGLIQHKQIIKRYNQRQQELDKIPDNTITEFKQILIMEVHKKLSSNFRSMGKKTVSIPCPESLFFAIFGGNIHYYSKARGINKCIFRGCDTYKVLGEILNSDQWGKKVYPQNQQTYVVCLDQASWNSSGSQSQLEEIDPLEELLQSSVKKFKPTRKPRFLRGEVLIEWKKKMTKEVNGLVNMAGYIFFNFYIAQSRYV